MEKKFYLNIFLLPISTILLNLVFRKKQVLISKSALMFGNANFNTDRYSSFGISTTLAAVFPKVFTPLPAISLVPF